MSAAIEQFRTAAGNAGIGLPAEIIADGMQRFDLPEEKAGKKSGWYVYHPDGIPAGSFGSWKDSGVSHTWSAKGYKDMTTTEKTAYTAKMEAIKRQREEERAKVQAACIVKAEKMLKAAHDPDPAHPYIVAHGMTPHGAKQLRNMLLIPLYRGKVLTGLQIITEESKKYLTGTDKAGAYLAIKGKGKKVYLVEGWADACKLHDLTGATCITCFDCGNLLEVGKAIRAAGGNDYDMVFVADNDRLRVGNPGVTKATAAALATGARLAIPIFPGDAGTDVCDLCNISGPDAALSCLEAARQVVATEAPAPDTETATETHGDEWPEPQPIESKMEPLPYPLDALPESIGLAVEEVIGFVKAPVVLVASAALSALSMAIQAHADIARAEKLTGPAGLYLLTIAESGERKSTCDTFFTKSIREYEAAQTEAAKPAIKQYEAEYTAWDAKYKGITDAIRQAAKNGEKTDDKEADLLQLQEEKPEPPRVPRIIYGDTTPEALKYSLAKQWPSGAVVSSEAGVVFGSHGMGKESAMRNLATLNQLWDGTDMPTERRSSESFTVRGARLTMALQTQESTLRAFFKASGELARGTGFLARFLIAWPESTQGNRPFTEAPENWPHLAAFNKRITEILNQDVPITEDGALQPAMAILAPDAKEAWVDFHDAVESGLATGGELFDIRDVASKIADNAARLACLFQFFEHGSGEVGLDAFESASRVAAWHLNEARRFFGGLALPQELADAARLDSWMISYCRQEKTGVIPVTKIQQYGPCGLRSKTAIDAAMEELEGLERARRVKDGKRRTIHINPALLRGEK